MPYLGRADNAQTVELPLPDSTVEPFPHYSTLPQPKHCALLHAHCTALQRRFCTGKTGQPASTICSLPVGSAATLPRGACRTIGKTYRTRTTVLPVPFPFLKNYSIFLDFQRNYRRMDLCEEWTTQ